MRNAIAHAHICSHRPTEAARWALIELTETPNNALPLRIGAASGKPRLEWRHQPSRKLAARLAQADPTLRLSNLSRGSARKGRHKLWNSI
jgi:hypothetical protein